MTPIQRYPFKAFSLLHGRMGTSGKSRRWQWETLRKRSRSSWQWLATWHQGGNAKTPLSRSADYATKCMRCFDLPTIEQGRNAKTLLSRSANYATECMCCFNLPTIEILGSKEPIPVVLDRVIGGSLHLDEASRVGQHLLSIVDAKTRLSQDRSQAKARH
jgi:hypothetical protein